MIKNNIINVRDFGAKGDYTRPQSDPETVGTGTDDSQAFKDALTYAQNNTRRLTHFGDRGTQITIHIPAGTYYITQPESMMSGAYTTPDISGLRFVGDGRGVTEIVYNPSTQNTYLLNNNNGWTFLTFEGISFFGCGDIQGNTLTNSFMRSYSTGQAQNYIFRDCIWNGGWKEVLLMVGGNTNSEHSWYHCGFSGSFVNAIYVPGNTSDNGSTTTGNDQFVNYNFFSTQFETSKGNYLNFQRGGSINIWGGSIMYTGGETAGQNGTFFTLGQPVNAGANRFHLEGVRMELASSKAQVINSKWKWGSIEFIGLDNSTQAFHDDATSGFTNVINSVFDFNGESGPIVSWINCQLQGKHQYIYGPNSYLQRSSVRYQNCDLVQNAEVNSFLNIVATGTNRGGTPIIQFDGTRSFQHNDANKAMDCTFGWFNSNRGITTKRLVKLTSSDNFLPRGATTQDIWLPINCIITNITFVMEANEADFSTTGWQFFVKTSEGTPTTLHTASPISNNPHLGMNSFANNVNFICDSDTKRHIVASANGTVDEDVRGVIMIEYIGG
jgi:hypothetical protein